MPGFVRELEDPDPGSLGATPQEMLERLGGPAVIRLSGADRARCRGVSALLHGNEPSGLAAVHAFLASGHRPAVDVVMTLGAVDAARAPPGFAHRFLPGRRDLNRAFQPLLDDEDGRLARAILEALTARPMEAIVDLHNNTGRNPAYGVVPAFTDERLRVVALFSTLAVRSGLHMGTLTDALSPRTSATIECGRAGDPTADRHAAMGLERFLRVDRLEGPVPPMNLYESALRVRIAAAARVAFGSIPVDGMDLTLFDDVDRHNFEEVAAGTPLGALGPRRIWPLLVEDERGADVSRELFAAEDGLLVVRRPFVPIMMTTSVVAAAQDCLCYLVERAT